jgi:methionyl-tRNA synthetase
MATVSDVKFYPEREGKCPECGREPVKLGRVNLAGMDLGLCIDCYFGPPRDLWENCPECGWLEPGWKCDKCGAVIQPEEAG